MQVKFNGEESERMSLIGGGPQGTILGQLIAAFHICTVPVLSTVAFHSSLTKSQSVDIDRIQRTSLGIILGYMYIDYPIALEMSNLKPLFERMEKKCLNFSLKCIKHTKNSRICHTCTIAWLCNKR